MRKNTPNDRCPLDGNRVRELRADLQLRAQELGAPDLLVCIRCNEILGNDELVAAATHATRRRYLAATTSDTEPADVPRLPLFTGLVGLRF